MPEGPEGPEIDISVPLTRTVFEAWWWSPWVAKLPIESLFKGDAGIHRHIPEVPLHAHMRANVRVHLAQLPKCRRIQSTLDKSVCKPLKKPRALNLS